MSCNICRSEKSELSNAIVTCQSCRVSVHQKCYGIKESSDWSCDPCRSGVQPECVLCPNAGGALKCTLSGNKWAHVVCALWLNGVSFGSSETMGPITKITAIPQEAFESVCNVCGNNTGACVQCYGKRCSTMYHVTCGLMKGLKMGAEIVCPNSDGGVELRSYCRRHSKNYNEKYDPEDGKITKKRRYRRRKRKAGQTPVDPKAILDKMHEMRSYLVKIMEVSDRCAKQAKLKKTLYSLRMHTLNRHFDSAVRGEAVPEGVLETNRGPPVHECGQNQWQKVDDLLTGFETVVKSGRDLCQ